MANPEHVAILKEGVDKWNMWRKANWHLRPNLSNESLVGLDVSEADFSLACLSGANLSRANLNEANLVRANLSDATLAEANLRGCKLHGADLMEADLTGADLSRADLSQSNLTGADLSQADLRVSTLEKAQLMGASLRETDLTNANLATSDLTRARLYHVLFQNTRLYDAQLGNAVCSGTIWASTDLTKCRGLEWMIHGAPSTIGHDTLQKARNLPEAFLLGCGLSDLDIEHYKLTQPDLTNEQITDILYRMHDIRATQAIQINPLFISYSHADTAFVDALGAMLTEKGVRYWRDIHHATAGKLEKQVDRAMRLNPTVLIVLSEAAVNSDWVEHEVESARKLEKTTGRDCLCPIALDDSWKDCDWPIRIMRQLKKYNILDFSEWQEKQRLERQFSKLLQGLDLFYE